MRTKALRIPRQSSKRLRVNGTTLKANDRKQLKESPLKQCSLQETSSFGRASVMKLLPMANGVAMGAKANFNRNLESLVDSSIPLQQDSKSSK